MTYDSNRYYRVMGEATELLGGSCVRCGETENLQFDHIDPKTKLFDISAGVQFSSERFWAEVAKCQLLCDPHHREKTSVENRELFGENNPTAKLRDLDIKYIFELRRLGHTLEAIANEFDIDQSNVWLILNGKSWSHLQEPLPSYIRHPQSKLVPEDIPVIHALISLGHSQREVARMFSVTQTTIGQVHRRESWSNV